MRGPMTTASAPDFRLYYGNALDVFAELLADTLRTPAPGQPLLAPDTILIPQAAMRRWLQAALVRRHGIAANLEFLTPGEFVARALDANLGRSRDDLDTGSLHWHLYAALSDPALMAKPAMAQLAAYVSGGGYLNGSAHKTWALAGELAGVFEKYQAWRRDWLLRWEAGADRDDPQAVLWRAVATGRNHRVRRIQAYLSRFAEGDALPSGLPARLFAFGTLNVSPDVLRVMATQARVGTLHFYMPTPTRENWGDLQTPGARLRVAGVESDQSMGSQHIENPLLRAWGAAGRDFMALLGSFEVVHPSGEIAAHAEPGQASSALPDEDGLRDSLLHRMQADLFHRRAAPSGKLRNAIDPDDPSLQAHACHTRLRELHVLHDRLRGLLEDPRFSPPLQPRDIAVLAPDIDPYAPYLEAVFGGGGHDSAASGQGIPYALADASPLACEPLAAVFLRLLDLPSARFGLEETLDLLASPALAEASGLDATDFERVHVWLRAAGARWGLDAAHRAGLGAPRDEAYTWQFALDRLLLGHASGSTEAITGDGQIVAPWVDLEGGALDALDALVGTLRVLARYQRQFTEASTPAQWRERLLALLAALLPGPPVSADGQRALERLRMLVDGFATGARQADFDAPVPIDVVRAYFTTQLTAADTRAPLLTGGVSFARMVPMRLLPFRVICVLGLNDGDFPRRDAAAGLNRLTAELGTDQRRPGDRSIRDDDRYLFLQLFSAAQDVFYVSWLGADARDGSVREPSAVVGELLAAAGEYHDEPQQAAQDLVLRHPLQPFSPTAFGAGDARHFSYRAHWQPAAGRLAGARARLAPWMPAGQTLPPPSEPEHAVSLETLRRFLLAPAEQFLRQRLGLRLPDVDVAGEDIEPLQAPRRGLGRTTLQRAVYEGLLAGMDSAAMHPLLRARGLLPSGPLGQRALQQVMGEVAAHASSFAAWRGDAVMDTAQLLEIDIDGLRLHGRLTDAWPRGIARVQFGKPNGRNAIRSGLDWLMATAAGVALPFQEFHEDEAGSVGPHLRAAIPRDVAITALRALLALRAEGLQRPLPFAPASGWALVTAKSVPRGVQDAAKKWRGHERGWAEGGSDALQLALRGREPFGDAASLQEFARVAGIVFGAVTSGAPTPIDVSHVTLPGHDDAGEEA